MTQSYSLFVLGYSFFSFLCFKFDICVIATKFYLPKMACMLFRIRQFYGEFCLISCQRCLVFLIENEI